MEKSPQHQQSHWQVKTCNFTISIIKTYFFRFSVLSRNRNSSEGQNRDDMNPNWMSYQIFNHVSLSNILNYSQMELKYRYRIYYFEYYWKCYFEFLKIFLLENIRVQCPSLWPLKASANIFPFRLLQLSNVKLEQHNKPNQDATCRKSNQSDKTCQCSDITNQIYLPK